MMKNQVKALLEKIELKEDPERKYFFIFDIDGTLRPDEIESFDHRHPKIPPGTALQLKEINLHSHFEIVILTARSYIDLFKSNFPKEIIKYCGCGKQILDNEIIRYPREEFQRSYDETLILIDILKDLLGKSNVSKIDFLVVPGDFAIYFNESKYKGTKKGIMKKVKMVLEHSSRWKMLDLGKEVVFIDSKYHYDKGHAVKDIMDKIDLDQLTSVFMFGDSKTDLQAMIGLREYQKEYPDKRLKVNNVSIGDALKEEELIDFRFETHEETIEFIELLHAKVFNK